VSHEKRKPAGSTTHKPLKPAKSVADSKPANERMGRTRAVKQDKHSVNQMSAAKHIALRNESLELPKSLLMKDAIKVPPKNSKKKWRDTYQQVPESRKPFKHPRNRQQLPTASAHAAHFFDHPDDIDYLEE